MSNWQADVRAWHEKFGVVIGSDPAIRRPELRAALIEEEARETCDAILRGDLVEAIDGLCDVIYVVCGTAVEFGIDLAPFFAEVHRTNMAKEGGSTRADGKILKPEGWEPPRIAEMLVADTLRNYPVADFRETTPFDCAHARAIRASQAERDARFVASLRVIYARWQDNDSYTPLDAIRDIQREHHTVYGRPCEPEVKEPTL